MKTTMCNAVGRLADVYQDNKAFYDGLGGRFRRMAYVAGCVALAAVLLWRCDGRGLPAVSGGDVQSVIAVGVMSALGVIALLATAFTLWTRDDGAA